tara:strand:+ start:577 stop:996 length:420 start_codon:yes stop_codon:yes gene_type:complete
MTAWTEEELSQYDPNDLLEFCIKQKLSTSLAHIKYKCQKDATPFDLELIDLEPYPIFCPILGVTLDWTKFGQGTANCSPSIDRINPKKGYVRGNCRIISAKANRLKNDGTLEELKSILNYMETNQNGYDLCPPRQEKLV